MKRISPRSKKQKYRIITLSFHARWIEITFIPVGLIKKSLFLLLIGFNPENS